MERSAGKFNECFAYEVIIEAQALSFFISTRRLSSFICAVAAPAIHLVAARIIGASINIHGFSGFFWLVGTLVSKSAAGTGALPGIALLLLRPYSPGHLETHWLYGRARAVGVFDLPVEQPIKFEFIINLKAAKQMGVTIPPNVLASAYTVIK